MSSYGRSRGNSRYHQFRPRAGYASGSFAPANARRWSPKTRRTGRKFNFRSNAGRYLNVSYTRDTEKKYHDWAMTGLGSLQRLTSVSTTQQNLQNGVAWASEQWGAYGFDDGGSTSTLSPNNLVRAPESGTSVRHRIGNQITVKSVTGHITIIAAQTKSPQTPEVGADQWGEQIAQPAAGVVDEVYQFLRTTVRVVIVRDNQVNTNTAGVSWDDVFQTGMVATGESSTFGVHAHLNVNNIGRFSILSDRLVELDADDPQRTIKFALYGNKAGGKVRYTGATKTSQSNKNIWIVWAAQSLGTLGTALTADIVQPRIVLNGRMCFTDM